MNRALKQAILLFFALLTIVQMRGQSVGYSQFYANPLYLNPALTGSKICPRLTLNYRNQWSGLHSGYQSYCVSGDVHFDEASGGLGIMLNVDNEADLLRTTAGNFMYSYSTSLTQDITMSLGIQAGFIQKSINWDELLFTDQIVQSLISGQIGPTQEAIPPKQSVLNTDFATGVLFGYQYGTYVGIALHHLTTPRLAFYDTKKGVGINRRVTFHAGTVIDLRKGIKEGEPRDITFSPNIVYMEEGEFKQLNIGGQINFFPIVGGVWFRHNFSNPDAIILMTGFVQERFKIGYSFDTTISKLGLKAGGAHEVSFVWFFDCFGKKITHKAIKCPSF